MSTVLEIPLVPSQPQRLSISLGGATYNLFVQWRDLLAQCWIMDLMDSNNNILVAGVPLLPGLDILGQYTEIGFLGQLWVETDGNAGAPPTFDNLGVGSHLYHVTP